MLAIAGVLVACVAPPAAAAEQVDPALEIEVWAPPENADGGSVEVSQEVSSEPWSPPEHLRVDDSRAGARSALAGSPSLEAPGPGSLPFYTFEEFQVSDRAAAKVNIANGNLFFADTDVSIPGPGVPLQLDRYYNSSTATGTTEGSFALGWASSVSPYDLGTYRIGNTRYVTLPSEAVAKFEWDGSRWLSPAGLNATLTENAASTLYRYVLTFDRTGERFSFDTSGHLRSRSDRNGVGILIDVPGYLATKVTHTATGRSFTLDYRSDFITTVTDSAGRVFSYPKSGGALASSPDGITYGYASGNLLNRISLDGVSYGIGYDGSKRVTSVTVRKAGEPDRVTSFAYNAGNTVVTDPEGRAATYAYDAMGRVTSTTDGLGRMRSQQWTANSDVAQSTDAIGTGTTTYAYDTSGNRTSMQLPTGAAASAVYATGVNCTAPSTGTAFQPKCSTDDAGNKKQYRYDAAGNLTRQTDTTTSTAVTEFEYTYGTCGGAAGQVCTSKDGNGNTTTYAYDSRANLTTVTPPSPMGATTYTYDALGRVASVTDGKGDTTGYGYDIRDRLVSTTFDDGQTLVSSYFPTGLEKKRTDSAGGVIDFLYNAQGRLTKQTGPRAGVSQTFTYDKTGNVLTYADSGGTTTYTYDAANQMTTLREPGGACPATGNPAANSGCILFEYDANGAETKRILPGGATTLTARDASARATRITAKTGAGATVVDIGYAYTPTGSTGDRVNVQSRTAHLEQGITAGAVTSYTYDSRNRVTLAQEKSGATNTASWAYTYDTNGNRTRQIRTGTTGATAGTISYGYNAANQLTSATGQTTTWAHDAAGNQTRNGTTGTTASFGDRGEQSSLGTTTGSYFGNGNTDRLSLGSLTFNNGALGIMQRTSGSTVYDFTRTPDGAPVSMRARSKHYYVHDHLGSVVGIFSGTGAYNGGYSYSPYGEARHTSTNASVTANPLRYIGEHHDGNGIYKLGARYYDTTQARFTQMDPSGQETNPYTYAECNPIGLKDPSGLDAFGCIFGTLGVLGISLTLAAEIVAAAVIGTVSEAAAWGIVAGITGTYFGLLAATASTIRACQEW